MMGVRRLSPVRMRGAPQMVATRQVEETNRYQSDALRAFALNNIIAFEFAIERRKINPENVGGADFVLVNRH